MGLGIIVMLDYIRFIRCIVGILVVGINYNAASQSTHANVFNRSRWGSAPIRSGSASRALVGLCSDAGMLRIRSSERCNIPLICALAAMSESEGRSQSRKATSTLRFWMMSDRGRSKVYVSGELDCRRSSRQRMPLPGTA